MRIEGEEKRRGGEKGGEKGMRRLDEGRGVLEGMRKMGGEKAGWYRGEGMKRKMRDKKENARGSSGQGGEESR